MSPTKICVRLVFTLMTCPASLLRGLVNPPTVIATTGIIKTIFLITTGVVTVKSYTVGATAKQQQKILFTKKEI